MKTVSNAARTHTLLSYILNKEKTLYAQLRLGYRTILDER